MPSYVKYAVGEVFLVVVGILIAIQIDNWNEERKKAGRELILMKQLLQDARADSVFFESRASFLRGQDQLYNLLLRMSVADKVDSISNVKMRRSPFFLYLSNQSNLITNNPDSYELLSNNIIKSKLRRYIASYEYVEKAIDLSNEINKSYGLPLQLKYSGVNVQFRKDTLLANFKEVVKEKRVRAHLENFRIFSNNAANQVSRFLIEIKELSKLLQKAIKEEED